MTHQIDESRRDDLASEHVPSGVSVSRRVLMNKLVAIPVAAAASAIPLSLAVAQPATAADPIFAAIEAHRHACAINTRCAELDCELTDDDPAKPAAEIARSESIDVMFDLALKLIETRPTTVAGAAALLNYVGDGYDRTCQEDWRFPNYADRGEEEDGDTFYIAVFKHVASALTTTAVGQIGQRDPAAAPAAAERPARPVGDIEEQNAQLIALGQRYEVLLDKYYAAHAAWSRGDIDDPSHAEPTSHDDLRYVAREMRKLPITSLEGLRARALLTFQEVAPLSRNDVEYHFGSDFAFQELFCAVMDVVGLSDKLTATSVATGFVMPPLWVDDGEEEDADAEA
jgi:hypothetical protein